MEDELLLKQEVQELTALLHNAPECEDLRRLLARRGHDPSRVVLAGLVEGDEELSYGVFILPSRTCVLFETAANERVLRWVEPATPRDWEDTFGAVEVGVAMVASGEFRSDANRE